MMLKSLLFLISTFVVHADTMTAMANAAIDGISLFGEEEKVELKKIVELFSDAKKAMDSGDCDRLQQEAKKVLEFTEEGLGHGFDLLLEHNQLNPQVESFVKMGKDIVFPEVRKKTNEFIATQLCGAVFGGGHEEL